MKTKKARLNLTGHDIRHGVPTDPCRCPVARAIMRSTKWRNVIVGGGCAEQLNRHGYAVRQAKLPEAVNTFIANFDQSKTVLPFCTDLEFKPI